MTADPPPAHQPTDGRTALTRERSSRTPDDHHNPMTARRRPTFYEFFAGAGMARAGLGPGWRCLFANDIDPNKTAATG